MKTIAFVPIRKGSKGITGKNTRLLHGKPLVFWILDTLVQASLFDEIWIATDYREFENDLIDRYHEKVNIYHRSNNSATDISSVMTVIREFILWRKPTNSDWFCLFQATSPFTTLEDIKNMLNMINSQKYDSIVSCVRLKKFRWSETATSIDYSLKDKPRRQDCKGFLVESGNFYSAPIRIIISEPYILSGKVGIIEVDSSLAIDIDEPQDWLIAEYIAANLILKL